jgi:hypothetical protein
MPIREGAIAGAIAWVAGLVLWGVLTGGAGGVPSVIFGYSALHLWALLVGANLGVLVFSVIPIAVLAGTGYLLAGRTGARGWIPVGGAVAVGYGGLALPSHLLILPPSVGLVIAVLFTGVLMPVVFAGLGGTFAGGSSDDAADADPAADPDGGANGPPDGDDTGDDASGEDPDDVPSEGDEPRGR